MTTENKLRQIDLLTNDSKQRPNKIRERDTHIHTNEKKYQGRSLSLLKLLSENVIGWHLPYKHRHLFPCGSEINKSGITVSKKLSSCSHSQRVRPIFELHIYNVLLSEHFGRIDVCYVMHYFTPNKYHFWFLCIWLFTTWFQPKQRLSYM